MGPEAFAILVSSALLTLIFAVAFFMLLYVMRRERSWRRLGSLIAASAGLLFWSAQLIARLFFGYVGPSIIFSEIGIFKDAIFACGVLWMALALVGNLRRAKT